MGYFSSFGYFYIGGQLFTSNAVLFIALALCGITYNMKTLIFTIAILTLVIGTTYCQNYSPLKEGNSWTFKVSNGSFTTEVLEEFYEFNGIKYFQIKSKYSWGTTFINYTRIDDEGNRLSLDPEKFTERVIVPAKVELGKSWFSADSTWKYTIIDTSKKLKTASETFRNCLVIKGEQITSSDKNKSQMYCNYYVDGIGYVGTKTKKGVVTYLVDYQLK